MFNLEGLLLSMTSVVIDQVKIILNLFKFHRDIVNNLRLSS